MGTLDKEIACMEFSIKELQAEANDFANKIVDIEAKKARVQAEIDEVNEEIKRLERMSAMQDRRLDDIRKGM